MGGSWAKRPVLKKTGCNRSTTGLFDFQHTGQLATGLITIDHNWQLQSSCDQLRSSPVASLCTSCQLDFKTLIMNAPDVYSNDSESMDCHSNCPNACLMPLAWNS